MQLKKKFGCANVTANVCIKLFPLMKDQPIGNGQILLYVFKNCWEKVLKNKNIVRLSEQKKFH